MTFNRVSVWLDALAPARGAFAFAREWAERLDRPLRPLPAGASGLTAAATLAPDLHVFGRSLPKRGQADIVRRAARDRAAFLTCPDEWQPLARALVLHDESDSDGPFLSEAVQTCAALQVRTVVLTVARSDRVARRRRQQAQETLAGQGRDCVFDQFAGLSVRPAVHLVACWRRCQVVVLERRPERLWWPLRGGDTLEQLTARPSPLAFLALPPLLS